MDFLTCATYSQPVVSAVNWRRVTPISDVSLLSPVSHWHFSSTGPPMHLHLIYLGVSKRENRPTASGTAEKKVRGMNNLSSLCFRFRRNVPCNKNGEKKWRKNPTNQTKNPRKHAASSKMLQIMIQTLLKWETHFSVLFSFFLTDCLGHRWKNFFPLLQFLFCQRRRHKPANALLDYSE